MSKRKKQSRKVLLITGIIILAFLLVCVLCAMNILPPSWLLTINSLVPEDSTLHGAIEELYEYAVQGSVPLPTSQITNNDGLTVEFIDVGQADCTLIVNGQHAMLIDAGNNGDGPLVSKYLKDSGVEHLEYVVGTHAHEDHIGGLDNIIRDFKPDRVMLPTISEDTYTYQDVLSEANALPDGTVIRPENGASYTLGDAVWTVIGFEPNNPSNLNESSIMIKLTYGDKSFVFTGDAEAVNERACVMRGYDLSADVLKVGHHGSETSNSELFLKAVSPKVGIISCGLNNEYGHPKPEVLKRLTQMGIEIHRTDLEGTIVVHCDGSSIEVTNKQTLTNAA